MKLRLTVTSFLILMAYGSTGLSHGDHGAPGAIPFAPHGGKAAEAKDADADEHGHDHGHDHGDEHEEEKGHDHNHGDKHEEKGGHDHAEGEGHDHGDEKKGAAKNESASSKVDYFFEATYSNEQLRIFPLQLDQKNMKEFIIVDPEKGISDFSVKIEFPRSKVTQSADLKLVKDPRLGTHWAGKIPNNKDIRFFSHISAKWDGEVRKASIHLEKKK